MQISSFLLAGFIFLAADLIQFMNQKKLRDRYSVMFAHILMTGIMMCVLSELAIRPVEVIPISPRTQLMAASAGCYICAMLHSYEMFRYSRYRLSGIWVAERRWERYLHEILLTAGIAAAVINVPVHFLYDIDTAGITHETGAYLPFMGYITGVCMMNACCVIRNCSRSIDHRIVSMMIAYSVMVIGIIITAFDSDMMFMCFGIVVSTNIIYVKLNNPLTYLDSYTDAFNFSYFRHMFADYNKRCTANYFLVIDLYQLEHITRSYEKGIIEKLIRKIVNRLWKTEGIKSVFHTWPERFIVDAASEEELDRVARCVRDMFRGSIAVGGKNIKCATSLVELVDIEKMGCIEELTLYAGYLMNQTEKSGKTQIIKDTPEKLEAFYTERETERVMETAVRSGMLETVYQPVYSLKEKRFVSMEALSRLYHPATGKRMSPDVFIRLAEESGYIMEITKLQVRRVCSFLLANSDIMETLDDVKINISAVEIGDADHCDELISIIKSSGVDAGKLRFEITETAVIHNKAEMEISFAKFRQAGISFCIDDFGSGYADFSNLVELMVTGVKLDRSLLTGICCSDFAATFYRNVARTLNELGFDVIAEGVETEEEVELLSSWGIDKIQGYYFARPMEEREFKALIRKENRCGQRIRQMQEQCV